jgi:uncharacterized membrane protein YagU involved in acid resistance
MNMKNLKYPLISGIVAGTAMSMFEMIVGIFDKGFWAPLRGISAVFGIGIESIDQYSFSLIPVIAGVVIHMIMSMMLGAVFFVLFDKILEGKSFNIGIITAMLWGFVVYMVMFWIVLPLSIFPGGDIMINSEPQWAWIVGHLMFGAVGYLTIKKMSNKILR